MITLSPKFKHDFPFFALVLIVILLVILTSCMTNRKGQLTEKGKNFIAMHCKGSDSVTTNHEIIFKDTTIYLTEKGETIYIDNPCDSIKSIVTKKNGIKSSVRQVGNGLVFECEADSLKAIIKQLERKSTIRRLERIVIEKPCNLDHISGTQWMWIRLGQILSGFLAFQVLIRLLSIYPILSWLRLFYVFKF